MLNKLFESESESVVWSNLQSSLFCITARSKFGLCHSSELNNVY